MGRDDTPSKRAQVRWTSAIRHFSARRKPVWDIVVLSVLIIGTVAGMASACSEENPDEGSRISEAAGAGLTTTTALPPTSTTIASKPTTTSSSAALSTSTTAVYTHTIVAPARIVIPVLRVDAKVLPVGIAKDGGMEVPDVRFAGWYRLGPAPGSSGPSVIIAHVSYNGTHGPFYDLKKLKRGDEILVYDESGDCATFEADFGEVVLKTKLPTERIWADTKEPVIRLITCGGRFNSQTGHYESNVIVYGHLVR